MGLTVAKWIIVVANITHFELGPKTDNPCELFKPLLSGFLRFAKGSRVSDMAIVLVQGLRDKAQVPLLESPAPFVHEFNLRGIGVLWVRHRDEAIEGGLLWRSRGKTRALELYIIYPMCIHSYQFARRLARPLNDDSQLSVRNLAPA